MSGRRHRACGGERFTADREGAVDDLSPSVVAVNFVHFVAHAGKAVEEQLAEISKDGGLACRDAVGGEEGEELAEGVVDVGGGLEFARDGGKLGGNALGIEDKTFTAGMIEAEGGVGVPARIAAPAAVRIGVAATILTSRERRYPTGIPGIAFHLRTSGSDFPRRPQARTSAGIPGLHERLRRSGVGGMGLAAGTSRRSGKRAFCSQNMTHNSSKVMICQEET
jgi:hypothetical protein